MAAFKAYLMLKFRSIYLFYILFHISFFYLIFVIVDADKARKHGMEDFISTDPCTFDHATLFKTLQNLTLEYRLNDPYASLVSLSDFCYLTSYGCKTDLSF